MTLKFDGWPQKNYRAPLLHNIKLCASSRTPPCIQTGVTVRKRSVWVKIRNFLSCVTLNFDVWPWKTIGHLFYATWSFVHHFKAINEFKLELQSGNTQVGSKSTIFCPVWLWNLIDDLEKTIGHLFYVALSFVHNFIAIGESKLSYSLETLNSVQNWPFIVPFDFVI